MSAIPTWAEMMERMPACDGNARCDVGEAADVAISEVRRALVAELTRWRAFAWDSYAMRQAHALDQRIQELKEGGSP